MLEELMHISEDTQVPPDWVSERKQSHLILKPFDRLQKILASPGEHEIKKDDYHKHA